MINFCPLQIVRFSRNRSFLNTSNSPKCPGVTLRHAMVLGGCVAMSPGLQWLVLFGLPGILRRLESTQMRPNICSRWDLSIRWWLTSVHLFSSRSSGSSDLQNPWLRRQRLPWCLWIRWRALEGSFRSFRSFRTLRVPVKPWSSLHPRKTIRSLPDSPGSQVIGTAKAKDIMAVHCELRRSEKEAEMPSSGCWKNRLMILGDIKKSTSDTQRTLLWDNDTWVYNLYIGCMNLYYLYIYILYIIYMGLWGCYGFEHCSLFTEWESSAGTSADLCAWAKHWSTNWAGRTRQVAHDMDRNWEGRSYLIRGLVTFSWHFLFFHQFVTIEITTPDI